MERRGPGLVFYVDGTKYGHPKGSHMLSVGTRMRSNSTMCPGRILVCISLAAS